MSNAIDDIGAKVGQVRGQDTDNVYALRVLQVLYRTYQSVNTDGWRCYREENEYWIVVPNKGDAVIARGKGVWYYSASINRETVAEGEARYLEKAMQICSLVLS
jgi:hypothetical protein